MHMKTIKNSTNRVQNGVLECLDWAEEGSNDFLNTLDVLFLPIKHYENFKFVYKNLL